MADHGVGDTVLGWSQAVERPPLLVVGDFLFDSTGIRFVCEDLAEGLQARGWSVLVTSRYQNRPVRLADMLATIWGKRRDYAVAQVDVYSGYAFLWAEAVGASLSALGCPYVLTLHSGAFPEFAERWPRRTGRVLTAATAVTSPSTFLQQSLAYLRPDIRVIRNGLHLERYSPRQPVPARPKLVWIRHFERRYNPVLAVEVVRRLAVDYPDAELVMAGPDRPDWSGAQTMAEARARGVEDRVRILGGVAKEQIPNVLTQGDIFVNTTTVDNTPVTVVEAMAAGLCIVSTNVGGVPHLLQDEVDALLVPPDDPEAMTKAVRRILNDGGLAARLSKNALRKARRYDWGYILPQWEMLLSSLASGRANRPGQKRP